MERFRLKYQDDVFFERYDELSDQQIRFYLDMRRAIRMGRDPQVRCQVRQEVEEGKGKIGIDDVGFIMDFELLCEKGFILRERVG
jgi:hypothetical protein